MIEAVSVVLFSELLHMCPPHVTLSGRQDSSWPLCRQAVLVINPPLAATTDHQPHHVAPLAAANSGQPNNNATVGPSTNTAGGNASTVTLQQISVMPTGGFVNMQSTPFAWARAFPTIF